MSAADDDVVIDEILAEALERQADGEPVQLATLCAGRPDLLPRIAAALGQAEALPDLHHVAGVHRSLTAEDLAGRYRLEAPLGGGSMGVVYAAFDRVLQRRVAVKILRTTLLDGREAIARFEREAEVLAAVRHPAVVAVYDRGATTDGTRFLVMELLDGVPLSRLLELLAERTADATDRTRDDMALLADQFAVDADLESGFLRQAVRWAAALAAGLQAVHDAGVLHRDVKPSNVFVRRDGSVVLVDFGIAARHAEATLGARSTPLGTPVYMDPHLLEPAGRAEPRSDVYSLAATLYHLVTRTPPYAGTPHEVLAALPRRDPRPPGALRPGLPRDLQALIECGMERDPARRYPTAHALAADLEAVLAFRPITVRPISSARRLWRRARHSREARAVTATLGLLAAVGAFGLWSQHDATTRQSQWRALWSRLPPELADAPVGMRTIADAAARATVAARLDQLVALDVEPLPSLLARAVFRLDHGDRQGAVADLRSVATRLPTPYAQAVAEAYAGLPDGADETTPLPLPRPPFLPNDEERYLAAFHLLRTPAGAAAACTLLDAATGPSLSLRELRLRAHFIAAMDLPDGQTMPALRPLQDEAIRIEALHDRRTALSATVIGVVSLLEERRSDALAALRSGVELAPESHSLRINHASVLRATGELAAAREQLEAAIRMRPTTFGARRGLLAVLLDQRDFAAAEDLVEETPFAAGDDGLAQRHWMRGEIALGQALYAMRRGEDADRIEHATAAIEQLATGAQLDCAWNAWCKDSLPLARALTGDRQNLLQELLGRAVEDPFDPYRLDDLLTAMPAAPAGEQPAALWGYLRAVRQRVAPNLPEPR